MRARFAGATAALLVTLGCGGENGGTPPQVRGDLTLSYVVTDHDHGAVLLTISGGDVEAVSAIPAGVTVSFASQSPGVTRVVVTGGLASGDLLKVRVPDVNAVDGYVVRIDQVAHAETFALLDPTGSSLTIRR
jgi:hypothetical protein